MKKISFVFVLSCVIFISSAFSQETLTITTYYPAPFGVYQELRARRIAIGDNYHTSAFCWPPEVCAAANQFDANADLAVEGNVGIGTTSPRGNLEVNNTIMLTPTVNPNSSLEGTFYYNSNQHRFLYRSNTGAWLPFGGGYTQMRRVEEVDCWWGGVHTLTAQCPAGFEVISCAGGPGDQDQNSEGFYIEPDLTNERCIGHFREPHCAGSTAERHQRVIAVCVN